MQEIDGEFIVYDLERNVANLLTGGVARVWPLCDGKHDQPALALLTGLDAVGVAEALEQLGAFGLLDGVRLTVEPRPEPGRLSRRSVIQRGLAVGAGVGAVSMITAVAIPASAAADSSAQTAKNPANYHAVCTPGSFSATCSPGSVCKKSPNSPISRCTRSEGAACFYSPLSPQGTSVTSVCSKDGLASGNFCQPSGHCP